jgi:hypothetical protein
MFSVFFLSKRYKTCSIWCIFSSFLCRNQARGSNSIEEFFTCTEKQQENLQDDNQQIENIRIVGS